MDENSYVLITGFVANLLRSAVLAGDSDSTNLLREIAQCVAGTLTVISEQNRSGLLFLTATGYVDKEGRFTDDATKALKFAIAETGIADLAPYQQIVNGTPAP